MKGLKTNFCLLLKKSQPIELHFWSHANSVAAYTSLRTAAGSILDPFVMRQRGFVREKNISNTIVGADPHAAITSSSYRRR